MKPILNLIKDTISVLVIYIYTFTHVFSQNLDFCGIAPINYATSTNSDSICWDRFGNSYDIYSDTYTGSGLNPGCQEGTGYFLLIYGTGINQDVKDVFCQVFSDLSDSIQQRINFDGCGDTLPPNRVRIEIRIKELPKNNNDTVLMAASPYFNFPFNYYCEPLGISFVERKINGSKNYPPYITDGYIFINTGIQNRLYTNFSETPPNAGSKYDAYSVALHEALHLFGFSSTMWYIHPDSLQGYTTWDKNIFTTTQYGTSNETDPLIVGDCIHNRWELNEVNFSQVEDLLAAIVNNCSSSTNLDFVFGESIVAPISGRNNNIQPGTNGEMSNLLSHLNANCNGNPKNYIMQPFIDTGEVRRIITNEELAIICNLGYKINSCDGCYLIPYADTEGTLFDIETCCETYFTACKNVQKEILFTEFLCNDFSNNEIELTDIFPNYFNFTLTDSSIVFTPGSTDRIQFGYTIKGCDCVLQNGYVNVYVGVCNNCDEISPCENLTCVNGFDNWDPGIGGFALHEYLTGVLWYTNLNNSVDICKVSNNAFIHIASSVFNREGMGFHLSEPVMPGCTAHISYKASVTTQNVYDWHVSELAPCKFSDSNVSFNCIPTICDSYEYAPQCIYSDTIVNIAEDITLLANLCPTQPHLDSTYSFSWRNSYAYPINYILVFPQADCDYNYIDDIVVTMSCIDPKFTFEFNENCQEVVFSPFQQDSFFTHLWIFNDGDSSTAVSPLHNFDTVDTFNVTHIVTDSCGNIDSFRLDVIIPEESILCCPDTTISTSTTWNMYNLPFNGRFHSIVVEKGVAFTINEDVELNFCEGGALIIEAGAYVDLEGDLNSYDNMTWKGVYVSGDSSLNQAINLHSGGYGGLQQGFLQTRSGASIKNADIAIRNYGKSGSSSSGGMIRCEETLFKNNTIGVDFIDYQNYNDSLNQPLNSLGSFTKCRFYTDTMYYLNDAFYAFARISNVDGVNFKACKFVNSLLPQNPTQVKDFGFGILAVDSEFKVRPDFSSGGIGPCPPPCTITDSTLFSGLGHGIYNMTKFQARPYEVYNSLFENCFRGITDITRGSATLLFNTFSLGEVPDLEFSYGQIGAEFHFAHDGFTLQENLFIVEDEETEVVPIGVLCNGLGEFDNEIRRNTFIGVETANQAFGANADLTLDVERGLVYFCNLFEDTPSQGYDFHIPDSPEADYIHPYQTSGSSQGSNVSTGNHFAYSAHDFINFGEGGINYWYYAQGDYEEPRDSFSLGIGKLEGLENDCSMDYCAPPCIEDVENIKEDFINHRDSFEVNLDNYLNALVSENQLKIDTARSRALYYRRLSSRDAYTALQHLMMDTLEYHTDSLITWMGYLDTYGSEVMIAGEYASAGDFESALDVLETVSARRDLSLEQTLDLEYLLEIYNLLEETPPQSITQADKSFLRNIAYLNIGASSGISRALLSSFEEYIPLPYFHGQQIKFRSASQDSSQSYFFRVNHNPLKIYPNPTNGDVIIEWEEQDFNCVSIIVYNLFSKKALELRGDFKSPYQLDTNPLSNGMHWIVTLDNSGKTISGKFILQRD